MPGGRGGKGSPHRVSYVGKGLEVGGCVCAPLPKPHLPYHTASLPSGNVTAHLPDPLPSHREGTKAPIPGSQHLFRCPSPHLRNIVTGTRGPCCGLGSIHRPLSANCCQLSPAAHGGSAGHLGRPCPLSVTTSLEEIPQASSGCGPERDGVGGGSKDGTIPIMHSRCQRPRQDSGLGRNQ